MATLDRLIGADASLYKASFGSTLTAGTMTSGSWYKIVAISGTSVFGSSSYQAGDLFLGNGQTLSATNSAQLATFTAVGECNGFDFSFNADEVEVTVLSDSVKKYRKGKTDLSGTVRGINIISEMTKTGSILKRFLRTVSATAANSSTISAVDSSDLYIQAYLQDDTTTAGETHAFLFGQVELFGYSLGAAIGDAQSFESGLRFIGNDPIVYFKANS